MKKNILIVSFSNIVSDPRVQRQIQALKDSANLTVLGFGNYKADGVEFISVLPPQKRKNKYLDAILLLGNFFEIYYSRITYVREAGEKLTGRKFDMIVANDIEALPIVMKSIPNTKIWYDAHEYAPRENEESTQWRFFFQSFKYYLCKKYMPLAAAITTVCDGIADEYSRLLGIEVVVIRNSPEFYPLSPSEISNKKIRFIHHGAAIRGRKLESMIELMSYLDERFHLSLMLVPTDPDYLEELRVLSKKTGRVDFIEPVSMKTIPNYINQFDLGIYFLEPTNFNQKYALPNKIFEFIQGRLGIVIGPSLEMANIVKKYKLGLVTNSFDLKEISQKVNALTKEDIVNFKKASHQHAQELSFENEEKKIKEIISKLV